MSGNNKFVVGCAYKGATRLENCESPTIFVTGRHDGGLHNEIRFRTNVKQRLGEMHRPIQHDYNGDEFVMAYGVMFGVVGKTPERCEDCIRRECDAGDMYCKRWVEQLFKHMEEA